MCSSTGHNEQVGLDQCDVRQTQKTYQYTIAGIFVDVRACTSHSAMIGKSIYECFAVLGLVDVFGTEL